jgi:hypothetical protein
MLGQYGGDGDGEDYWRGAWEAASGLPHGVAAAGSAAEVRGACFVHRGWLGWVGWRVEQSTGQSEARRSNAASGTADLGLHRSLGWLRGTEFLLVFVHACSALQLSLLPVMAAHEGTYGCYLVAWHLAAQLVEPLVSERLGSSEEARALLARAMVVSLPTATQLLEQLQELSVESSDVGAWLWRPPSTECVTE